MTHKNVDFRVPTLARVEGEGALHVEVRDDTITDLRLEIYEPPRFFEAFLYTAATSVNRSTSRLASVGSAGSRTMPTAATFEQIAVAGELHQLRRLLYASKSIESHVLHIGFLHAPDFLDASSGFDWPNGQPELIRNVLRLKKMATTSWRSSAAPRSTRSTSVSAVSAGLFRTGR